MRYSHVLGTVVGLAAATAAQALMQLKVTPVIIPGATRSANPALVGVRTYDLQVVTDAPAQWTSADIQFNLATGTSNFTGSFYNDSRAGSTGQKSPLSLGSAAAVNQFDTWLSSPERIGASTDSGTLSSVLVLGKAQYPTPSGPGLETFPAAASGDTAVNVAWGTVDEAAGAGTYTIARFSIKGNTGANISGRIGYTNNTSAPLTFSGASSLYLPILGDTNADRVVDQTDFDLWFANVDAVGNTFAKTGDMDLNGVVDQSDFDAWFANVDSTLPAAGPTPGASLGAVVPEPASFGLVGAGMLLAMRRRKA